MAPADTPPAGLAWQQLWRLANARPQLLLDHASAYADLMQDEGRQVAARLLRQAVCWALAFAGLLSALTLAGVAVLLGSLAALPLSAIQWGVLLGVPLLPLLGAALALQAARQPAPHPLWAALRAHWAADRALLRAHSTR